MTLDEAKRLIGKTVVYLPALRLAARTELGVISSVNDTFVFVRWRGNVHAAATRPEDLQLRPEGEKRT